MLLFLCEHQYFELVERDKIVLSYNVSWSSYVVFLNQKTLHITTVRNLHWKNAPHSIVTENFFDFQLCFSVFEVSNITRKKGNFVLSSSSLSLFRSRYESCHAVACLCMNVWDCLRTREIPLQPRQQTHASLPPRIYISMGHGNNDPLGSYCK
jgi:hypothetical protein